MEKDSFNNGFGSIVRDIAETKTKFKLNKWAGVERKSGSYLDIGNFNKKSSELGIYCNARANNGVYDSRSSKVYGLWFILIIKLN